MSIVRINGVVTEATVDITTGAVVQPPIQPPPVQPPPVGGYGPGDITIGSMPTTSLFPQPIASASGPDGTSISFFVDGLAYPNGLVLRVFDDTPNPIAKEIVISDQPHSFSPLGGQEAARFTPMNPQVTLRFNPVLGGCHIQSGVTYYLNFRPATPGNLGTTYLQIGASLPSTSGGFGGLFGGF